RLRSYVGGHYYTHFAGVEHEGGNEKRVTPIKKGDLRFEPLAEYLADENPECTIISSSPLLEHDAMYMKVIYERVMTKKVCKDSKAGKKDKSKSKDDDDDDYDDDKDDD
ncbi:MAG: AP endonuclease, partial [Methanomassiliicoccales archaeon]